MSRRTFVGAEVRCSRPFLLGAGLSLGLLEGTWLAPVLLAALEEGKDIALVTDAGFPGISDPGEMIAQQAIAAGLPVVPVPGANACLTALVASGMPSTPFFFGAFLPKSR